MSSTLTLNNPWLGLAVILTIICASVTLVASGSPAHAVGYVVGQFLIAGIILAPIALIWRAKSSTGRLVSRGLAIYIPD